MRNVNLYYGEEIGGKVGKIENNDDMPYLVYQDTKVKLNEFRGVKNDDDSYKSFVCEKDLDWFNLTVSASYQLI